MERIIEPTDQQPLISDELPKAADPVHHGDDDMPAPIDLTNDPFDEIIEQEPVEDPTKW